MELKIRCHCGQKFKFDVEPMNSRMPFTVACPACGADGTGAANEVLAQLSPSMPVPPAPIAMVPTPIGVTAPAAIRVNTAVPSAPPRLPPSEGPRYIPQSLMPTPAPAGQGNMLLGIAGAVLGAGLGAGIVVALAVAMGFGMSLLCIIIGLLSGTGARILYRGNDSSLGFMAAGITLIATGITLFLLFGIGAIVSIVALVVSTSTAWKIAS